VRARLVWPKPGTKRNIYSINVVARSMAYLGGAGAHACELDRTEQRPGAERQTYAEARNPDSKLAIVPKFHNSHPITFFQGEQHPDANEAS
jgi:hypothetical protein